jgi:hypothetical protein
MIAPTILDTGMHMQIVSNFQRVAAAQATVDELSAALVKATGELESAVVERMALMRGFGGAK